MADGSTQCWTLIQEPTVHFQFQSDFLNIICSFTLLQLTLFDFLDALRMHHEVTTARQGNFKCQFYRIFKHVSLIIHMHCIIFLFS